MFPVADDDPWTEIARREQVRVPDLSRQLPLDFSQVLTLVGSILLVAGVYLPFHRGQSLWQIGLLDGVPLAGALILVLAQVSLALAMMRWHVGLWLTSFAVFMTVICSSFDLSRGPAVPVGPAGPGLFGLALGVLRLQEGAEPALPDADDQPTIVPIQRRPNIFCGRRVPMIDAGSGWALLMLGAFSLASAAALAAWQDYRQESCYLQGSFARGSRFQS
jgi:hypothetical protein